LFKVPVDGSVVFIYGDSETQNGNGGKTYGGETLDLALVNSL